ncbi:ada2a-containing complex component 3 [Anaeramoeba flamelloides]|uniref:Ada2a-containing complex component 3 n=1 Tax=Anaeramoeba flamelloides TaxID=1746091 RepID=A0ABQ8YA38_9EUKA|nr:ada2a-containing complex component 3 [Anaeramoeba flamelloides]
MDLIIAARKGDIKSLKKHIKEGKPINYQDSLGKSPLLVSCETKQNSEIVKLLVKKGADVNLRDKSLMTPLHYAFWNKEGLSVVKILLNAGANVKMKTKSRFTALHYACIFDVSPELIQILIDNGAKVNARNNYQMTPLHYACENKIRIESIRTLLAAGADVNAMGILKRPIDCTKDEKIQKYIMMYSSLFEDFQRLFKRVELTDYQINGIKIHRLWVELRMEMSCEELETLLKNFNKKQTTLFFKWVYTGLDDPENSIINLVQRIGISRKQFKSKSNRIGLVRDLEKLSHHEESKDFSIFVEQKEIKVHRLILQARSELFRGMFISIKDKSTSVKDYTGKTYNSFYLLLKFLYTDKIPNNLIENSTKILQELDDAINYYQLNQYSVLSDELELIKQIIQKKKKKKKEKRIMVLEKKVN